MIEYIRNILPRIQQYSKSLDHKENYVDKPWVFIDNNGTHEYEFCRDGRLIMSLDGQAQFGRWEYRAATQRLLIERPTDAILLQNAFIDDGLMILKKSASDDPAFILVNSAVVPDLDIIGYLQRFAAEKAKSTLSKPQQHNVLTKDIPEESFTDSMLFGVIMVILIAIVLFILVKSCNT